ncbi:hypothetical protein Dimus_010514, partial [Dionaea muscipula]
LPIFSLSPVNSFIDLHLSPPLRLADHHRQARRALLIAFLSLPVELCRSPHNHNLHLSSPITIPGSPSPATIPQAKPLSLSPSIREGQPRHSTVSRRRFLKITELSSAR